MIQFATQNTEPLLRSMWKTCFEDTDEFIDLHFSRKYKAKNTLIYFDGDVAAASLQMFEYEITFYGETLPFYYLAGLCTLPQHRKKGYMAQLIAEAHRIMEQRDIPLSILIPAEEWLYGFYRKYGYEQVFEGDGDTTVPLKEILDTYSDIGNAYRVFDMASRSKDFYVQKTFEDFEAIVAEYYMDGCPPKHNLSAMAHIIDKQYLLNLYAAQKLKNDNDPHTAFRLLITDSEPPQCYQIQNGYAQLCPAEHVDIEADICLLCRLLFGFKTSKLPQPYPTLFAEHQPVINLMLE